MKLAVSVVQLKCLTNDIEYFASFYSKVTSGAAGLLCELTLWHYVAFRFIYINNREDLHWWLFKSSRIRFIYPNIHATDVGVIFWVFFCHSPFCSSLPFLYCVVQKSQASLLFYTNLNSFFSLFIKIQAENMVILEVDWFNGWQTNGKFSTELAHIHRIKPHHVHNELTLQASPYSMCPSTKSNLLTLLQFPNLYCLQVIFLWFIIF